VPYSGLTRRARARIPAARRRARPRRPAHPV